MPTCLQKVSAFVRDQTEPMEVIVVDDGSTDATAAIVEQWAQDFSFIRLIRNPHGGKGAAVRAGVAEGQGEYLFISDTDLAVPIEEIRKFLPPQLAGYDLAVASREATGSQRINEPFYRHNSWAASTNLVVQLVAVPAFRITQCGFKAFRRDVAREIFPFQTIEGWGFDVELLFVALRFGYKIAEVPVTWYYGQESKISPVKDTFGMLRDLWQVRLNARRGLYERLK